jgi:hypothetical protein
MTPGGRTWDGASGPADTPMPAIWGGLPNRYSTISG